MGHWFHTDPAARVVHKENSKLAKEFGSRADTSSEMWQETISLNISRKHTKWQKLLNCYLAGIVGPRIFTKIEIIPTRTNSKQFWY